MLRQGGAALNDPSTRPFLLALLNPTIELILVTTATSGDATRTNERVTLYLRRSSVNLKAWRSSHVFSVKQNRAAVLCAAKMARFVCQSFLKVADAMSR